MGQSLTAMLKEIQQRTGTGPKGPNRFVASNHQVVDVELLIRWAAHSPDPDERTRAAGMLIQEIRKRGTDRTIEQDENVVLMRVFKECDKVFEPGDTALRALVDRFLSYATPPQIVDVAGKTRKAGLEIVKRCRDTGLLDRINEAALDHRNEHVSIAALGRIRDLREDREVRETMHRINDPSRTRTAPRGPAQDEDGPVQLFERLKAASRENRHNEANRLLNQLRHLALEGTLHTLTCGPEIIYTVAAGFRDREFTATMERMYDTEPRILAALVLAGKTGKFEAFGWDTLAELMLAGKLTEPSHVVLLFETFDTEARDAAYDWVSREIGTITELGALETIASDHPDSAVRKTALKNITETVCGPGMARLILLVVQQKTDYPDTADAARKLLAELG